jgi:hypothetical protein
MRMTKKQYITLNAGEIRYNSKGHLLVLGCNYHLTWQSHKQMRFVLDDILHNKASMITRTSHKRFITNVDDLIFIKTRYNELKARELLNARGFLPMFKPQEGENELEQAAQETNEHLEQT